MTSNRSQSDLTQMLKESFGASVVQVNLLLERSSSDRRVGSLVDADTENLRRLLATAASPAGTIVYATRIGRSSPVQNAMGGGAPRNTRARPHISVLVEGLKEEALSMDHPVPTEPVVSEAKRIFGAMPIKADLSYDLYSTATGGITIAVDGALGRGMILVCEPDGSARSIISVDNTARHAYYEDSGYLPDDFVRQGLREMSSGVKTVPN